MKKMMNLVLVGLLSLPVLAHAQEGGPEEVVQMNPSPKLNGIHFNPVDIAFGVISLGYERILSDHVSLRLEGMYTRDWYSENINWGVGARIKPYFFLTRNAPAGLYLAPFFAGAYSRAEISSAVGQGFGWAAGGLVGYSWLIADTVNIRLGGGVQYLDMVAKASDGATSISVGLHGVLPAAEFSLGFVF